MSSSYSPPIRRKDSIGLIFSFNPDYNCVCDVIFDQLDIKEGDIVGFQQLKSNTFVIKFNNSAIYESYCDTYDGKELQVGNNGNVRVINFSKVYTYVSIRHAPFDMENDILENILSKYGKLHGIRLNTYFYGRAKGLLNGTRTARMELKANIPSSISVLGHKVYLYYNGQKRTCYKCGGENHLAATCEFDAEDRHNILSEEDFPSMNAHQENSTRGNLKTAEEEDQATENNLNMGKSEIVADNRTETSKKDIREKANKENEEKSNGERKVELSKQEKDEMISVATPEEETRESPTFSTMLSEESEDLIDVMEENDGKLLLEVTAMVHKSEENTTNRQGELIDKEIEIENENTEINLVCSKAMEEERVNDDQSDSVTELVSEDDLDEENQLEAKENWTVKEYSGLIYVNSDKTNDKERSRFLTGNGI